jgi:membrane protein
MQVAGAANAARGWMAVHTRRIATLLRAAGKEWLEDNSPQLAAALAFYMIFSLAPVSLIAIAIAGAVYGQEAARGELVAYLTGLIGPSAAAAVQGVVEQAGRSGAAVTIVGVVTMLFGASVFFAELQEVFNTVWGVTAKPGRFLTAYLRKRLLGFAMVLGIGVLLLASLVASTVLSAFAAYMVPGLPAPPSGLVRFMYNAVTLGGSVLVFAWMFKWLPDARVSWRDVWIGAAISGVLFMIGKGLISAYLGRSLIGSVYGAAGSLVVLLVWVYYTAQILLFGAQVTYVHTRDHGGGIVPSPGAVRVARRMLV